MFPEGFVERHVLAHTKPGDVVFDPFCGRGTTVFQSLLMKRQAAGLDINPVAACVGGAKADPPSLINTLQRLSELEQTFGSRRRRYATPAPFFHHCFHVNTLKQILFLRETLAWRTSKVDRFIAAMTLGALHGESHKSTRCLSNRMPRTISTKPDYSIRWWQERGLIPPERDAFFILRDLAKFRFSIEPAPVNGTVKLGDARTAAKLFPSLRGRVRLVVTSPPYLDVTDYAEDQWLRLWFLGGKPAPNARQFRDDRLTQQAEYWTFLRDSWRGLVALLAPKSLLVVRIGGRLPQKEIAENLLASLRSAFSSRQVLRRSAPVMSEVKGPQTNIFRPGAGKSVEHDFVFAVR
jgi:hypothetical protein